MAPEGEDLMRVSQYLDGNGYRYKIDENGIYCEDESPITARLKVTDSVTIRPLDYIDTSALDELEEELIDNLNNVGPKSRYYKVFLSMKAKLDRARADMLEGSETEIDLVLEIED